MGIPVSNDAAANGCTPISSTCVIYQGSDIECLDICSGSSINAVFAVMGQYICDSMTPGTIAIDEVTATESLDANYHVIFTETVDSTDSARIYDVEFQYVPCVPCADGAAGEPGSAGAIGTTGPVGPTGATGATGAAGINGADGADGADGSNGTDGADGTNGTVIVYSSFADVPLDYKTPLGAAPSPLIDTVLEENVDIPAIYLADIGDSIEIFTFSQNLLSTNSPSAQDVIYQLVLEEPGGATIDVMDVDSSIRLELDPDVTNVRIFAKKVHVKRISATKLWGYIEYESKGSTIALGAYSEVEKLVIPFELVHNPTTVLRINYVGTLQAYDLHGEYKGMNVTSNKMIP